LRLYFDRHIIYEGRRNVAIGNKTAKAEATGT
jgi:hypothetical protein